MTSGKDTSTMGESPIFTCKAHVFHIDPKTKRSWVPASSTQVNVSFFYDNTRALYRIISVEAQKAVINSTVTPTMTFTKTSQKFGQWSDVRANTVYGLGFGTEVELQKFIDKFNEVKEATRSSAINKTTSPAAQVTNGGGGATTPANASPITTRVATATTAVAPPIDPTDNLLEPPTGNSLLSTNEEEDLPLPLQHPQHPRSSFSSTGKVDIMENSPSHQSKISSPICDNNNSVMQQLKYENDRLKLALAQSSANAKKWEHELATLKSNNARLTSALQESTANVDEWKRQLASLKDENLKMKNKYQTDLENSKGGGELADELRKEIQNLRIRVAELENGLESKNVDHTELRKEQDEMQTTLKLAQSELEMANSTYESQKRILLALNQQFAGRIHELAAIHDEITQALES